MEDERAATIAGRVAHRSQPMLAPRGTELPSWARRCDRGLDGCTWRPGTPSADVEGRAWLKMRCRQSGPGQQMSRGRVRQALGCLTSRISVTTPIPVRPVETRSCGRSPERWPAFCLGWDRTFLFQARPKPSCAAIPTNSLTTQAAGQVCDGACIKSAENSYPRYPRSSARGGRFSSIACNIAISRHPKPPRQRRTPRGEDVGGGEARRSQQDPSSVPWLRPWK